jgi:glycine betaine/proline transport system ATP-binding protein
MVFITHDLNEALKLGDRIAIMRDGEFVQIGTPEDIVLTPEDEYVSKFVQDVRKESVLTAKSVMKEPAIVVLDHQGPSCRADTPIDELIPMLVENHHPIPVVDQEDRIVGEIHGSDVLRAIAPAETKESESKEEMADV